MEVKPHDPQQVMRPEELRGAVDAILGEPMPGLSAEIDKLARAHEVLRAALQEN